MRTSLLRSNREITIWGFRVSEAKATSFGDMALDKVKELVSSNPVVIFRFSLFFFVSVCIYRIVDRFDPILKLNFVSQQQALSLLRVREAALRSETGNQVQGHWIGPRKSVPILLLSNLYNHSYISMYGVSIHVSASVYRCNVCVVLSLWWIGYASN